MSRYCAHSAQSVAREQWHQLAKHLEDTATSAAAFLASAGYAEVGRAAGILHDLGKYTPQFQRRLDGGPRCDHATAGAEEAIDRYGPMLGKMLAFRHRRPSRGTRKWRERRTHQRLG